MESAETSPMIPALTLWLPVLLSAVAVLGVSCLLHRILPWHRTEARDEDFSLGRSLASWFLYCLLIGLFTAYLAGLALEPGARFLAVFRFTGAAAFGGYALALLQNAIWRKQSWGPTLLLVADGFIYALVTAAVFGWLWPG